MKRFSCLAALFLSSLLAVAPPALAWGRKAHAVIATIAESNLTPAARVKVDALLKDDLDKFGKPSGRRSLADVASWADEIRDTAPKSRYRGWHSRNHPICSTQPGPCRSDACVDAKLHHYVSILKDSRASHRERNEALKFVVHLVGDLHAPLHAGSNHDKTGHFPATIKGKPARDNSTLHSLWDHDFVSDALRKNTVSAKLAPSEKYPRAADPIPQWLQETRTVSRKYVYHPLPGFACHVPYNGPVALPPAYLQQALPVVRTQIRRAGLRLAQLLNASLDESQ